MNASELKAVHEAAEQHAARLFRAPGRVNLVGEHTDYSGGFCMPAALHFETRIAASPRADRRLKLRSIEFKETVEIDLDAPLPEPRKHWSAYPLGVLWSLRQAGFDSPGAALTLTGDVPQGAGLSSSASLEVATATALLGLAGATLPGPQLAKICQRAENDFVGAPCGIMDQFISANGRHGSALILDTRALTFELAPIPAHLRLVIANSMVKHSLADGGEYSLRRREVEEAAAAIAAHKPSVKELRDATLADLEACRQSMSEAAYKRARHVISDSQRVLDGLALLRAGDIAGFGQLLNAAHASYRDDFEASCAECDLLQQIGSEQPGCYGARLTGGGFGGCVVNLVEADTAERFAETLRTRYLEQTGIRAEIYLCSTADGAGEVEVPR
ncbi:MAG TPA: galactokinase [Granulicella sp.]|nr:galactokinase [Granulicella sp.]